MNFNEHWTKEDNNLYRKLVKERKTPDEIISIMGIEKLKHKPNGYYSSGGILKNFNNYLKEIVYTEKYTTFNLNVQRSKYFKDENNYIFTFKTDNNFEYVFEFIYYKDSVGPYVNYNLYNLSFTSLEQKNKSDLIDNDKLKTEIYEKPTDRNEIHDLIKRLIYIFNHFHNYYGKRQNAIYFIGETENLQKIIFYRDLIKSSFKNVIETKGDSTINLNLPVYYFEVS